MPHDMLVKLYQVEEKPELCEKLRRQGVSVRRAMPADKARIVQFVKNNFGDGWAQECSYTFTAHPVSCFVAVREHKVIGFACYDATAKNFFGPTGVYEKYRGSGIGEVLLRACMLAMKNDGYAYAVIGGVEEAAGFYKKTVGAVEIADSFPGVYGNLISFS
jgi:predicted N-acetyltransferase YhbS